MKFTTRDALRIVRLYDQVEQSATEPEIKHFSSTNPSPANLLLSFTFRQTHYAILFDDILHDEIDEITREVEITHPGTTIQFVKNPKSDVETYAMPYQGKQCYLVTLNDHTDRLDKYMAAHYSEYSRASWQHFIKDGRVYVDGETVKSPKVHVDGTETITYELPSDTRETLDLPILYRDEDVIVINKPAGVLTHPKNERDQEPTVESFLRSLTDNSCGEDERYSIVHRLDRDTSGVLICALNPTAYTHLKRQFANRHAQKTYIAISSKLPKNTEATIDIPLARSATKPGLFVPNQNGKSALTSYKVEEIHGQRARIKVLPKTGRTHQIRVHMAYVGAPILGDRLYGDGTKADRLYLHARTLTIELPSGATKTFEAQLPPEFHEALSDG